MAVLALTGAILAADPVMERALTVIPSHGTLSVAAAAELLVARHSVIDRIERTASGTLTVSYDKDGEQVSERVDPRTGRSLGVDEPSGLMGWVKDLHRSFLLGDYGRICAGICAVLMFALSVSGTLMLAAKLGGWRHLFRPVRGAPLQRLHTELARVVMGGLVLSSLTACYMSLATFSLVPDGTPPELESASASANATAWLPIGSVKALQDIDINSLRELVMPRADELDGVYEVTTSDGVGRIDPSTGNLLTFMPNGIGQQIYEWIYLLHTGQGFWPIALVTGLSSLAAPILIVTGTFIWWRRWRDSPRLHRNARAGMADTIILVGSEGGATWRFAATLHRALVEAGFKVHTDSMNSLARSYPSAQRLLILTSTYGDGAAPSSAKSFLARLRRSKLKAPVAVLGFGDRSFPNYCAYAERVASAVGKKGMTPLMPFETIDRQSFAAFAHWCDGLAGLLCKPLTIDQSLLTPRLARFSLQEGADYGASVGASTAILRFIPAPSGGRAAALPSFEAGDLVGIVPPHDPVPRLYSLASSSRDGVVEVCVRKREGGVCSTYLHGLKFGDTIEAFIKPNHEFRVTRGRAPVVLIGAGTGIGPLIGFVRQNRKRRPMYLYWGGRDPDSDFLYEGELTYYLSERRLSSLRTAFSRIRSGGYVQDRVAAEASIIRDLVVRDAQFLVCGGSDMAAAVASTIDRIVRPIGLDLTKLKTAGRYIEDVY